MSNRKRVKITYLPSGRASGLEPQVCHSHAKPTYWTDHSGESASPERRLHQAMIMQRLHDLSSNARKGECAVYKQQATHWIFDNSGDFLTVCEIAGFSPDKIRQAARIISEQGFKIGNAPRGTNKRYLERKAYRERLKAAFIHPKA